MLWYSAFVVAKQHVQRDVVPCTHHDKLMAGFACTQFSAEVLQELVHASHKPHAAFQVSKSKELRAVTLLFTPKASGDDNHGSWSSTSRSCCCQPTCLPAMWFRTDDHNTASTLLSSGMVCCLCTAIMGLIMSHLACSHGGGTQQHAAMRCTLCFLSCLHSGVNRYHTRWSPWLITCTPQPCHHCCTWSCS